MLENEAYSKLQWGHDQLIVEGGRPPGWWCGDRRASMGPRSVDRGRRYVPVVRLLDVKLQWGHDQLIVEGGARSTAWMRKRLLQWGHDQLIVEGVSGDAN